jgi:glycosyltransferase involved in cell wall biosynthesis
VKILQVNVTFTPLGGGTTTVIRQLSESLVQKGHELMIYAGDFKLDREYISGMQEVKVHTFHNWLTLSRFYLMPGMIGQVRRTLKDFDIVHLHCVRSFPSIVIHHYARKYGIPYVLQAHGSLTTFFYKGWLKRSFDKLWGYRILRDAAKVIALTQTEAEQYKSRGVSNDKIEIVPNGIDLSEFENLPQRGEFRRKYGLDDNERVVLYLGRIHKIKGLDLLARAFADLSKSLNDIKLVIVGPDGGYLPSLKKLVGDLKIGVKVLFTGPLYGQDKLEAYVDADVYILPSFYETFPSTVLEALACQTPVILTDRCGIADVINGQMGLVVPYDKEALCKALLHILSDNKLRQHFEQQSQSLIHQHFTWHKIVGRVEEIYQNAINSPGHLE